MNKIISFTKFSQVKQTKEFPFLSQTSVTTTQNGTPAGFVFGRDTFISLLTTIDESFEEKVSDQKQAYDNPAGRLIDLIEEKLTVSPDLVKELKLSREKIKESDWIPLEDVVRSLHV